jgi:hypothetical protein
LLVEDRVRVADRRPCVVGDGGDRAAHREVLASGDREASLRPDDGSDDVAAVTVLVIEGDLIKEPIPVGVWLGQVGDVLVPAEAVAA